MKTNIKELKERALKGDLNALEELRQMGLLSGNRSKYTLAPVSYAQRRLWFIDKMDKSPAYNLTAAIILKGNLSIEALEYAFKEIFARHEILRTAFVESEGAPFQKIFNEIDFRLGVEDISDSPDTDVLIKKLLAEESGRIFDLSRAPLLICKLYKLRAKEHILLFNMHHIISDGWSVGVLTGELNTLYNTFVKGEANPLPPLQMQYKEFARIQTQKLEEGESSQERSYWLNKFSGELPLFELPPDFHRPLNKTFSGKRVQAPIPESTFNAIKNICIKNGVSHFMFLFSAVNTLLYKYSGMSDIIVGSPVSGREHRGLEDQIGFYVNTIPLRSIIEPKLSFSDFLKKTKVNLIEAYDNQSYPFDLLVEELDLLRDTSRNPLFEVVVSHQESDPELIKFEGVETKFIEHETLFSKFDIHFNFEESDSRLFLSVTYNPDLYSENKIKGVTRHFTELLNNIVANPDNLIGKLEIISKGERYFILNTVNDTHRPYPKDKTLQELFEEICEKSPEHPAVVFKGMPLTYSQLNNMANFMASNLKKRCSLKLDEPVVILMDRSHELIASILGVIKAGGAYLPLDINMPDDRIQTILNDSKARIIICHRDAEERIPQSLIKINPNVPSDIYPNISSGKSSSNLAYILYTSGSTGTPKGSMIEEKSVIRLVRNTNYFSFGLSDRHLSVSSISFDATTFDIWGMLLNGGTLYLERTQDYLDPQKFSRYVNRYSITSILISTGLFAQMAEADELAGLKMFEGVKVIMAGGDRFPCQTANYILNTYPGVKLINVYGPTESTTFTTTYEITQEFESNIPIGRPISNTTVYIFDKDQNLCPPGVAGELYIGGEGLSRGYLNRPELNSAQLVQSPLNPEETLYKSGDMALCREDGNLMFLGRNDDQLKIRGFRIETGEIESIASKLDGVTGVRVVVLQEEAQKELALYFTTSKNVTDSDLRKYLSKKLPDYMVPKYFAVLEEFPLNKNGKIDEKSLPKPLLNLSGKQSATALTTYTGKVLTNIFKEVLNVSQVSVSDNFFALGGHSLKAIKALSAIQKELAVKISLKDFFANPVIESLEKVVKNSKREELGAIPVIDESDYYNLSHAQKRLWVLDKIEKSKSTYNVPIAIRILDTIDPIAMQQSFDIMVAGHESLRTVFIEINGEPFQKIVKECTIPITLVDFSADDKPERAAYDYVAAEASLPFNLGESPLVKLFVLKAADENFILLLNIHHIICDGWSLSLMIDELFSSYRNIVEQKPLNPAKPKIQYKDYAYWLNNKLANYELESDRTYWLKQLGGDITPLDLPSDFHRPAVKSYIGKTLYHDFSKELKNSLDAFSIEKRSSLFMTLTAALNVLLYRYSGNEDIIVGTPVAGRDHPDLENQIGYYVNTLALRNRVNPEKSFADFLEDVKKSSAEGFSHQMYPFDKLIEELKLARDTSRSPLFDIVIVLQNFDISFNDTFKKTEPYKVPLEISKYDLTFNFNDTGDSLELLIEYNTKLFRQERIEQMVSHLTELLNDVISNPSVKLSSANIINAHEKRELLLDFNNTLALYPHEKTIVDLFEEAASVNSNRTALVFKEREVTYLELKHESDSFANHFNERYSFEPGEVTGVLMSPSDQTVTVLLAILKAGGSYLPIDPEYPDERIKHILSASKTKIFITSNENEQRLRKIAGESEENIQVINIDRISEKNSDSAVKPAKTSITPDTTAYVIFTSGSTGKPKGCPITHRNLVRLFVNEKNHFDFNSSDVWIMAHSYCFDFSVWEMYGALLFGGKLIIPERDEVRNIASFTKMVKNQGVTVLNQTPGAFYKFIESEPTSGSNTPLNLRYVIFGGDKLNPLKFREWIHRYPTEKVKLINMYGITETTIHVTYHSFTNAEIENSDGSSVIGKPLPETKVYILTTLLTLAPKGVWGEIYVAGTGLSMGYLNRPDLTSERFVENPYVKGEILYKSGDIGRWLYDGTLEYLDRSDNQVQIRGFRVEISEIEIQLRKYAGIKDAVVVSFEKDGVNELAAYLVSDQELIINKLKGHLTSALPEYMVPALFIRIEKIPLTPNGKLDKKALPAAIQNIATGALFENPANKVETDLLEVWQQILSAENISIHDNFFDIGGNSILLVKLHNRIEVIYPGTMELTDLFSKSAIFEQAEFIALKLYGEKAKESTAAENEMQRGKNHDVAIVGIASRIGDCSTPFDFWQELCKGRDFIGEIPEGRVQDIKELFSHHGIDAKEQKFREYCYLNEVDRFDPGFFRLSPTEAALIDPGQRIFLETAIHAIEDAGYGGNNLWNTRTGVFIGASENLNEYAKFTEASQIEDPNLLLSAQTPSILAGRLAYLLNLKGPAMLVDTACSSSLVALHLACQSIKEGKINAAIVGGVKLHLLPIDSGIRLEIDSPDSRGHCFDDTAGGTGGGEGAIAIFIKPLSDAVRDCDNIYAVIKGSDVNQDGSSIGLTAPDSDAQADVIDNAWRDAGVDPLTISFIETHGTATKLGDPIEIEGISKAFRRHTSKTAICAIGAVKANVGHLDTAAGLAGVLKATLSLKYKKLTPLVHFNTPNRNINFDECPAFINRDLTEWQNGDSPLRCGVSSFGLSGTNCHVVMEEAPAIRNNQVNAKKEHLFILSARTEEALIEYAGKILNHIVSNPTEDAESICYTLSAGRGYFSHRLAVIFDSIDSLNEVLLQIVQSKSFAEAKGVSYNHFKTVASNKKSLSKNEITELQQRELTNKINSLIANSTSDDIALSVAEAYLQGAEIDWKRYYGDNKPFKTSLPGYPFEKKRCWVKVLPNNQKFKNKATDYGKSYEALLLNNCLAETPTTAIYSLSFDKAEWLIREHKLMGEGTLVGTAYLQIALEAGKNHMGETLLSFDDFYLLNPLKMSGENMPDTAVSITKKEDGNISAEVTSKSLEDNWLTHSKFTVSKLDEQKPAKLDIPGIKKRMTEFVDRPTGEDRELNGEFVSVSSKWNCIKKIEWNDRESLAELFVPSEDEALLNEFHLYPPLIDAAISFAIDQPGFIPYSFGNVCVFGRTPLKVYSFISRNSGESSGMISFDITLTDEHGDIFVQFSNFILKKVQGRGENYFHEMGWRPWPILEQKFNAESQISLIYSPACDKNLVEKFISHKGVTAFETNGENYDQIFEAGIPSKMIFLLPPAKLAMDQTDDAENLLSATLYSAFNFSKYLTHKVSSKTEVLFAAQNVCDITGNETQLNSLNYSVAGLGQVLQREGPGVSCRFIDYEQQTTVDDILAESDSAFEESYYYRAYREGQRYIREIKPVMLKNRTEEQITFKKDGVYLITGGTKGVGFELARSIARQSGAKIALVSRSGFVPADKLVEIEKESGGVQVYKSDVSNYESIKSTIEKIEKSQGAIFGIIHAAGVAGEGFIYGKRKERFDEVINPKIQGTINLARLFKEKKPDFFLMTSALTAFIPTAGQSDYTAANAFMDAFSLEINRWGINAQCINLTSWSETGMAFEKGVAGDGLFKSLKTKEGVSLVEDIIKSGAKSVILGEPDLKFLDSASGLPFYLDNKMEKPSERAVKKEVKNQQSAKVELKAKDGYIVTPIETEIAQVWGEVLGYELIDVSDNYYDLGGDSIHAIKIIAILDSRLKLKVTIGDLLNHLSIGDLAAFLESGDSNQESTPALMPVQDSSPNYSSVGRGQYPVSSAQKRLYILDQLTKDKLSYHIPEIWNLKGKLDKESLINAFKKLIERHEILRTSFELSDDIPVQVVNDSVDFEIPVSVMDEIAAREHIRSFIKPFELDQAPLFRTEIIELEPDNHLLLFDAHHIIIDAFSMEVLKRDIFDLYQGIEPAPLKLQYKDYSIQQNSFLKREQAQKKKEYWMKRFSGDIPVIDLPLDYPRTAGHSTEAGVLSFALDQKLTAEIKSLSSELGVSTFMILLTVYNIVMHKYTKQDDIIIGVTTVGRDNPDLSPLLGMFVNNMPIRSFPNGQISVRELMQQVKETVLSAFANQDYPFDELVDKLNIKRDLSRSPLFDIVFSYMNFELSEMQNSEIQISDYKADTVISAEYDLMLYGLEARNKIFITVKYKKGLFKKESIEKFAGHFTRTAQSIIKESNSKIAGIDILLPEEKIKLASFNNYYEKLEVKADVIDLLNESFFKNSDSVALIYNDRETTYKELDSKVNRLANYLQIKHKVQPEDLIGIMLSRTEWMVVAIMAVIKSGAAYVGIDPAYPPQRINYIINDSKAKVLITESYILQTQSLNQIKDTEVVNIEDSVIWQSSDKQPEKRIVLSNLAYVIYTSGTTGNPKGVAICHNSLSVFLHFCQKEYRNTRFDIVYAVSSYCFDISVFDIFFSLIQGKKMRILSSALEIPKYIGMESNVVFLSVPSLVSSIKDDLDRVGFQNIVSLNMGGEQIPQTLLDSIDCDTTEVRNLYGPSEDTTFTTLYKFSNTNKKVLIGKPISNTQIYIVDSGLQMVPLGHIGEICITGDGLARGYLYKEELTKQKFVQNPFGDGSLYKTGDLGRWTETGDIEFIGRIDRQVKIRGYRIELGEIETHIRNYPFVDSVVAIAFQNKTEKDLAAYIVPAGEIEIVKLKEYLAAVMPPFMIPNFFIIIDKIPLTPNGKVDEKSLPLPDFSTLQTSSIVLEALTTVQSLLADIWREVLEVGNISMRDNFFDLGGHSLKAIRLLSRINKKFNCSLALSEIFEYPTIEEFSHILDNTLSIEKNEEEENRENGEKEKEAGNSGITLAEKADYYKVSHAQRRLWVLDRVEGKSIAYNVPVVYHIKSPLDIAALQSSFDAIIRKYESLRTSFMEVDGEPVQIISEEVSFRIGLQEVEVEGVLTAGSKEQIHKLITEPFDLDKAPLIKVNLIKAANRDEYILVINIHHIVVDEWSIDILSQNLANFYNHFTGKKRIADENFFKPAPVQYKDYSLWHNSIVDESINGENPHLKFWKDKFSEPVQNLNLPADFPRPKTQTFEGKTLSFALPESLSKSIRELGTTNNTTLFVTNLAILNVLFSKYTRQNDVVIGTPIANRGHHDVKDQIGFFLNTLALRNRSEDSEPFSTFLNRVKSDTLKAFDHQLYPFNLLVDELQLPRDFSHSPLFDVMLISQTKAENGTASLSGLEMELVNFDYTVSKFDLSISYFDTGKEIRYFFEYNTALFKEERIEKMFSHFTSLANSIAKDKNLPLNEIEIISEEESKELFNISKGADRPLQNRSVVQLIEKQAVKYGNNLAIVYKRRQVTYAQLNDVANRLSHYLIHEKGVRAGDRICVMTDRSEWSVIAMLSVLKAGGVYVPVDPAYPQSRLEYIYNDSTGPVSNSRALFITLEAFKSLTAFSDNVIVIEEVEKILENFKCNNPNVLGKECYDQPAYVIYTSGSTGEPKGVLGTHRCLLNLIEWQSGVIESHLKTLQYAPHIFDVSVQEILFTLSTAGTLYMIDSETRYKMGLIAEIIAKEQIEVITMPFSALNLFLSDNENIMRLKSLRHVITSGEQPFVNQQVAKLLLRFPHIAFHNQYGPSETHVVTAYTISGGTSEEFPFKVPAGRPINNTGIYLLDSKMKLVAAGIPGELYIGGYNVAIGYINKPDMTAERFIKNPYGEGVLYKSGDLARWDMDGNLEYLGRDDGQVKVRGFRVELGEIESCLLKYPGIKEAAVKLTGQGEDAQIAAYYTSVKEVENASIKAFLATHLPAYMMPGYFTAVETMPHTPSGKIDLRSLPEPDSESDSSGADYIEPSGETEIAIAQVWSEILHKEKIGAVDNFFELGGNSIKAIQVMSRVQKRLGKKTYLNLIFKEPTIAGMAKVILNTDVQLQNMETDIVLLNKESDKKIFFLPPGIGFSFAYMEYASYIDNFSVYGINFPETDSPAESIVQMLLETQSSGEYYLFGHSAGGNLAYDVAVELQKLGRSVGGIILLDSYRQLDVIAWSEDEYVNDAFLYIEQNHAEFLDEEIKDSAFKKIVAYRRYLNARAETQPLNCPIIQIEANDEIKNFNHNVSRDAWKELASDYKAYGGFGGHMDMLKKPNTEQNSLLTKELLEKLLNREV